MSTAEQSLDLQRDALLGAAGVALMIVSQIANAAGFFAERARAGRSSGAGAEGPGRGDGPAGARRAMPRRPPAGRSQP